MAMPGTVEQTAQNQIAFIEEAYFETVSEAFDHAASPLTAHKEGVVAAAMLLSALTGTEDDDARRAVVALGLRPPNRNGY